MKIDTHSAMVDSIAITRGRILANGVGEPSGDASDGFAAAFKHAIDRVDGQQHEADALVTAVDSGESDDLVGAMLSSQEAQLSFSMLMQARNRLMSAFEDVIKLQL